MDVFDLVAKISLDTSGYENGLSDAATKSKSFVSGMGSAIGGFAKAGAVAFTAAASAVVGFGASAISVGQDFDKSMSQVAATMGKTMSEMEQETGSALVSINGEMKEFSGNLRDFAQFMGQNTAFSATQAADALNFMALAGYNTQESISMLPNVLNLAAAGDMELARASDMVTDAQTAFGLEIEDMPQLIDEMAKAASTGNTSVEQLGDAFLVVGGLAQDLNGGFVTLADGTQEPISGIQEMEVALTAMANAGVKGSEAGTHMRNMLLKLSSPTADGVKAFEQLGVSVFDAGGQMRSLKDIFSDLDAGLSTLTQEQKLQAISDIFNTRDVAAAEALLSAVGEDWDEIGASILDAEGAAAQMAATQLDNLAGDITLLKSAFEGAQIAVSDELMPSLREFVQFGTSGLTELTTAFKEGGLDGAMEKFGEILSEGLTMVIGKIPDIMSAAGELLVAFGNGLIQNAPALYDAAVEVINMLLQNLLEASQNLGGEDTGSEILQSLFSIGEDAYNFAEVGMQIITNFLNGITQALPALLTGAASILGNLINGIVSGLPQLVSAGANVISALGQGLSGAASHLIPAITGALTNGLKALTNPQALTQIFKAAMDLITNLATGIVEAIPVLIDALPAIIENIVQFLVDSLPVLIDAIIMVWEAIAENLPTIIESLVDAIPQILDAILNGWIAALPIMVEAAGKVIELLAEHLPEICLSLIQAIPRIVDSMILSFMEFGAKIREYFDGVFAELGALISNWWAEKKQQIADGWNTFIENVILWFEQLPYNLGIALGNMINNFLQWAQDVLDWIETDLPVIIENIVNWFVELPGKIWEWLKEVINKLIEWAGDMIKKVNEKVPEIIDAIATFFEELPGKALTWGKDMIQGFIDGIGEMAEAAWNAVSDFAQGIADRLGFSEPKIGPLSNFHTYAPDMMKLFAEGVKDNTDIVTDQIEKSFDFSDFAQSPEYNGAVRVASVSDVTAEYNAKIVSLLTQLLDKENNVILEGDAKDIFRVVDEQNRSIIRATGYNQLSMARVKR